MTDQVRILIVDDDKDWADYCRDNIPRNDVAIEVSYEVADALKKIEDLMYDIIFCDIKMRYVDNQGLVNEDGGFLICGRAKQFLPQAKIIMVTSFDSSELAVKSLYNEKSYYYLPKALDPQLDIIKMESLIDQVIGESREISPNPFLSQMGQSPKFMIVNRKLNEKKEMDLLLKVVKLAERGNLGRFLVLGQMGYGKSCLLMHYKRYLQKLGYLTSYYKIPKIFEKTAFEVAGDLLLGIIDGFPKYERVDFNKFQEGIKKIGIKINAYLLQGQIEWEKQQVSLQKFVRQGLLNIYEDLKDKTKLLVILLDDLHNLSDYPVVVSSFLETLVSGVFAKKAIIFGGSCLTQEKDFFSLHAKIDVDLVRFFSGTMFSLSDFSEEEIDELVFQTLSGTGVTLEDGGVSMLYQIAGGHPYKTQLLLYNLYENQINGMIKIELFTKALKHTIYELKPFYQELYGELNNEREMMVQILARSDKGLSSYEIKKSLLEIGEEDLIQKVDVVIDELVKSNIIEKKDDKTYHIKDRLFMKYIKMTTN